MAADANLADDKPVISRTPSMAESMTDADAAVLRFLREIADLRKFRDKIDGIFDRLDSVTARVSTLETMTATLFAQAAALNARADHLGTRLDRTEHKPDE